MQDLSATEVDRILPAVFDAWATLQTVDVEDLPGRTDEQPQAFPEVEAELGTVLDEYRRLGERIPHERSLVHGDWGANNLLVADGRITGILDWESVTVGDPIQDIAGWFWATWPPVVTCMTRQAAYADRHLGHLSYYRDRVLYHDLRLGLHEITAALRDGDQDFADWAINRCRELLA